MLLLGILYKEREREREKKERLTWRQCLFLCDLASASKPLDSLPLKFDTGDFHQICRTVPVLVELGHYWKTFKSFCVHIECKCFEQKL
jgi:hypothetical protein